MSNSLMLMGVGGGINSFSPTYATIALPSSAQNFWSLIQSSNYSGPAILAYRSYDGTTSNIGYNPSTKMIDTNALVSFSQGGNVFVQTAYSHVPGGTNATQSTPALMPYIVQNGVVVTNANGTPAMRGCVEGRYLVAPNASPGSQEYCFSFLLQNNVNLFTPGTTAWSPIAYVGSNTSTNLGLYMGGGKYGLGRSALSVLKNTGQSAEYGGTALKVPQNSTNIVSWNIQQNAVTNGCAAGTTLFFNRGANVNSDVTANTPINIGASAVNLFFDTTANATNGADLNLTCAYMGTPLNHADRQSLEGQYWDYCRKYILTSNGYTVPTLGTSGEVFAFSNYASDAVAGAKGNATLNVVTAANGSTWQKTADPSTGWVGLFDPSSTGSPNFSNNFMANNTLGASKTTFTSWVIFTPSVGSQGIFELWGMSNATPILNTTSGSKNLNGAWNLGEDHNCFSAWLRDPNAASTEVGYAGSEYLAYLPYGSGFVNIPNKDDTLDSNNQPIAYPWKKILFAPQDTDLNQAVITAGYTYILLVKHKLHPLYSTNPSFYNNKSTAEFKMGILGNLDGFNHQFGSHSVYNGNTSAALPTSASRLIRLSSSDSGLGTAVFCGWTHFTGFIGDHYTTDAEDQAIFFNALDTVNY